MRKSILYTGLFFLMLNAILFLLLSSFVFEKFIVGEVSILLSFTLLYYNTISKIDNGFKIFLSFSFVLSGVSKYILSFFFKLPFQDNSVFIAIVIISALEIISLISFNYFSKHS
mgnify:CR=1 FL=1